ncbi:protein FAR-RED IMPAIRED RESPONSE 1-like [Arachis hypogaea]|uniref:protein FAR-RED IMPAIRED RESPONSE 1-like n=1 Tax=Arachis hypogaea TaxID=3818 RepID=UPI0007AF47C8
MKDIGLWTISKVVLNHSHPCCADQAEMLKQHRELSMFANARSRAAFDYFRDVVSFDTTYNTNRYNLVLGSFIGVNHHGQSTLLGCVLMKNEDIQSFKWLFEFWLHCMGGRPPKETGTIFLQSMASEVTSGFQNSSLRQFVKQYDNCLASREQAEREFDATDFYTVIPCATKLAIEAQFQHVYTHEKFKEVQAQFRGKVNCITRSMHSTLGFTTHEVIEQVFNSTFNKFVVTYDTVSRDVKCHFLLFESRGILSRHSLSILSFERVDNVAPKYILELWSKNIKMRHTHIKSSQDEPLLEPRSKRFDELVFRSHNICEFASESEELTGILHRAFDKVTVEMEEYQGRSKGKKFVNPQRGDIKQCE